MLVAGWIALFGDARVSFLNPTIFIGLLAMVMACGWRLTGSPWRGLAAAVLIAICPTRMYWWSLTLTRDLSAHLFAFVGLYQLIPRDEAPLTWRRAIVAGLALGFAASIRNDAVLYLLPAALLAGVAWRRERPPVRRAGLLLAGAMAALLLGLMPTLAFNAITTGNPLRPTQGMEVEHFFTGAAEEATMGAPRVGYPSGMWRGTTTSQVSGGGLRLENFPRTAPREWQLIQEAYGPVLIGLAGLGVLAALVVRPLLVLFTIPYAVAAFLFYSCWFRYDPRYIIGVFIMLPLLIVEGVVGSVELLHRIAERRGEGAARPAAAALALAGLLVAIAPIPPPPLTADAAYLAKNVPPVLMRVLPLATAIGAAAIAVVPSAPVASVLAPTLAIVLAGFGVVRADATRAMRAPFQRPQATIARETLQRTLERRSVVITSEDIGRPAENIEYYGGFPAFYLTDLDRWKIKPSQAALAFISAGVRPYLLIDRPLNSREAEERRRIFADLTEHGFTADRLLEIPPGKKMQYFVAAPMPREVSTELFRVSHPKWEEYLHDAIPAFR
jgi:4-amino-4-deoxy-L-arabinose transferase-like glycosyltransferase